MYSTTSDTQTVKHCERCGTAIVEGNAKRKYCPSCQKMRGRQMADRICSKCGANYQVIASHAKYVEQPEKLGQCAACRAKSRERKPKAIIWKECSQCGEMFAAGTRGPKTNICRKCKNKAHSGKKDGKCSRCGGACRTDSKLCKKCYDAPGARKTLKPKKCAVCGRKFQPKSSQHKYCGRKECSKIGRQRTTDERLGYPNRYVCRYCGETYKAKAKDRDTFCGREHAKAWREENPILGPLPATAAEQRVCVVCGNPAASAWSKTCGSDECKRTRYLENAAARSTRDRRPRACKECGEVFVPEYGDMRKLFHTEECARKYGQRVGRSVRRARIRNAAMVESVDPLTVFKRDGWRCKMCGCKTPMRLRGTTDDAAPELDHVIPLAHGGNHTYANTQCLCRKCNQAKGATVGGQLSLL